MKYNQLYLTGQPTHPLHLAIEWTRQRLLRNWAYQPTTVATILHLRDLTEPLHLPITCYLKKLLPLNPNRSFKQLLQSRTELLPRWDFNIKNGHLDS